jgi:metal-dependent hydrolase (beta-lactamase superfamily II)
MTAAIADALRPVDALNVRVPQDRFCKRWLSHMRRSKDGSSWEPDSWIMDERYVAAHIKSKGIIVFTACSHAGVINVLKDASTAFAASRCTP